MPMTAVPRSAARLRRMDLHGCSAWRYWLPERCGQSRSYSTLGACGDERLVMGLVIGLTGALLAWAALDAVQLVLVRLPRMGSAMRWRTGGWGRTLLPPRSCPDSITMAMAASQPVICQ
jgi:hypothetical protein